MLDYVDPALPLSKKERRAAWRRSRELTIRSRGAPLPANRRGKRPVRRNWLLLIMPFVPAILMNGPLFAWMFVFHQRISLALPTLMASLVLTWTVIAFLGRWTWKPHVNAALRERGFDVCEECGYWLRGLDSDVKHCPECGAEREPMTVRVPDTRKLSTSELKNPEVVQAMEKLGYTVCRHCGLMVPCSPSSGASEFFECPECGAEREPMVRPIGGPP